MTTFGDLRSLLQRTMAPRDKAKALRTLMVDAHTTQPEQYTHEWLPYLQQFALPLFPVERPEEMVQLCAIFPDNAQFLLQLNEYDQDLIHQWSEMTELKTLRGVSLYFCKLTDAHIQALLDGPCFQDLTDLSLTGSWLGEHLLAPLLQSPVCTNIQHLDLGFTTWKKGDEHHKGNEQTLQTLLQHTPLSQLKTLNLSSFEPDDSDVWRERLGTQSFDALEELHLYNANVSNIRLNEMLDASTFPKLKFLQLSYCPLGDGAQDLANASALQTVETLKLDFSNIGDRLTELLASPYLGQLKHLSIDRSDIGDEGLRVIEDATHIDKLEVLYLQRNTIGDIGMSALVRSPHMSNLKHLDLRANKHITSIGVVELANATHMTKLQHLDLEQNKVCSGGIFALAHAEHISSLRHLELDRNEIDDEGFIALVESPHITKLTYLDINRNPITTNGVEALARSTTMTNIEELGMTQCQLGDDALHALSQARSLKNLKILRWNQNKLGDDGFTALVDAPFFPQLTKLRLEYGNITNVGMMALNKIKDRPLALEQLTLFDHDFGDEGIAALASCQMPYLKKIDLRQTNITSHGSYLLKIAEGLPSLKEIETDTFYDDDW